MKLYIIHCYDSGILLPKIDRQFVTSIMKYCVRNQAKADLQASIEIKVLKDEIQALFDQRYQPTMIETLVIAT